MGCNASKRRRRRRTCEIKVNETPQKLAQNWSFLDFQSHIYVVLLCLRFILAFHLDGGFIARQINRLVIIIFITSIISIIILDRMDVWAGQSVGGGREGGLV